MISARDVPVKPPETAGNHIIGYFLNWGLFGALIVQVLLYYLAFPRDRLVLKLTVLGLLISDTVQTVLLTNDAFLKFGIAFSDVHVFGHLGTIWFSISIVNAINGAIFQLFFAYRILTLSGSRILGGVVAFLAIAGGAGGIANGICGKLSTFNTMPTSALSTRNELTIWLSISSACDVLIVICMVTILSQKRNRGLNPATDDAVKKIIRLTVETGALTTAAAVITMILIFVFPTKAYCNISIDLLGKLYSNNFLIILNRRMRIGDGHTDFAPQETTNLEHSLNFHTTELQSNAASDTMMEVKIQRQVWRDGGKSQENSTQSRGSL